jgi:hypothetical protein
VSRCLTLEFGLNLGSDVDGNRHTDNVTPADNSELPW